MCLYLYQRTYWTYSCPYSLNQHKCFRATLQQQSSLVVAVVPEEAHKAKCCQEWELFIREKMVVSPYVGWRENKMAAPMDVLAIV